MSLWTVYRRIRDRIRIHRQLKVGSGGNVWIRNTAFSFTFFIFIFLLFPLNDIGWACFQIYVYTALVSVYRSTLEQARLVNSGLVKKKFDLLHDSTGCHKLATSSIQWTYFWSFCRLVPAATVVLGRVLTRREGDVPCTVGTFTTFSIPDVCCRFWEHPRENRSRRWTPTTRSSSSPRSRPIPGLRYFNLGDPGIFFVGEIFVIFFIYFLFRKIPLFLLKFPVKCFTEHFKFHLRITFWSF
jgi:hypothetical protein